jgi:hypothetical protein
MKSFLLILLASSAAVADEPRPEPRPQSAEECLSLQELAAAIGQRFGETVIAGGAGQEKGFLLMGSEDTGTWSLLFVEPDGAVL